MPASARWADRRGRGVGQVRELMKHAGFGVKQLKRTRIGGLRLSGLGVGQVLVGPPPNQRLRRPPNRRLLTCSPGFPVVLFSDGSRKAWARGDGAGVEIVGAENRAGQDVAGQRVTGTSPLLSSGALLEATSSVSGSIIRVAVEVALFRRTSLAQAFVHRCQRQEPGSGVSSLFCARVAT